MHAPVSRKLKRHGDHSLHVLCPITKNPVLTKIATDVRSLSKAWHSNIEVSYPHCNMTHKYKVNEALRRLQSPTNSCAVAPFSSGPN